MTLEGAVVVSSTILVSIRQHFEIKGLMKKLAVAPYNERKREGILRYVQLTAVARESTGYSVAEEDLFTSVEVVLVVNNKRQGKGLEARDLATELWSRGRELGLIHSIWLNFHPGDSDEEGKKDSKKRPNNNLIIGSDGFELLHGEEEVWQRFGGPPISLGPGAFVQANFNSFTLAMGEIRKFALEREGAKVLELHAGVGSIGLSLFGGGKGQSWLRCVELNPAGEVHFQKSKERLIREIVKADGSIPDLGYVVAAASDKVCLEFLRGTVDMIICDPPKKGLEPELLSALVFNGQEGNQGSTQTLIYLSCGWAALKREMGPLMVAGWRVVHAQAYLFFPGTEAIETLVIFKR